MYPLKIILRTMGSRFSGKSLKLLAPDVIFKAKCTKHDFLLELRLKRTGGARYPRLPIGNTGGLLLRKKRGVQR